MQIFNPVSVPMGGIALIGGMIRGMDFTSAGNSSAARCDMTMLYDGLAIELIGGHGRGRDHRTISKLINQHILLTANPLAGGDVRTSSGEFIRDPLRSPWNFFWKTVFAATKDAIGVRGLI
jgi:hypothetical protein